ncbi:hypothetical protein DL96DRAFT_1579501 [Flagelloscypha sp. PMI_526]|nr:hypothetical protein DL96DRAFT_1579501 [Flagelloscypha sp. PMI_526]
MPLPPYLLTPPCELSSFGRATSTIMLALFNIGINAPHSFRVPFFVTWISPLAWLRVMLFGIWGMTMVVQDKDLDEKQWNEFWMEKPAAKWVLSFIPCRRVHSRVGQPNGYEPLPDQEGVTTPVEEDLRENLGARVPCSGFAATPETSPTVFGWATWAFATIYAPIFETGWMVGNWKTSSAALALVRGLGIAIIALPLTIDTKQRYSGVISRRWGHEKGRIFNALTAGAALYLSILSAALCLTALFSFTASWIIFPIYFIFLVIWTLAGFAFVCPRDGADYAHPVVACAGAATMAIFLVVPILMATTFSEFGSDKEVGYLEWLKCGNGSAWQKLSMILP